MKVEHYTVPEPVFQGSQAASEFEILDRLAGAIAQETDSAKRRMLKEAAALLEQLSDEARAYRDAAEIDPSRPRSMRFRGWNMGRLARARRITEAALGPSGS